MIWDNNRNHSLDFRYLADRTVLIWYKTQEINQQGKMGL